MQENESKEQLYTLIPLEDFKAILSLDDRDDKTASFCLVTSTLTIEQYCRRRFLEKKYFETINLYGELCLPLNEYPISEILAVYSVGTGELLEPEFYRTYPDINNFEDLPYALCLSPAVLRMDCKTVKVIYYAGYKADNIPADLSAACLELAIWNFNRYKGRHVGLTGSVRKDGEKLEMVMPENVRILLEPYRRKLI